MFYRAAKQLAPQPFFVWYCIALSRNVRRLRFSRPAVEIDGRNQRNRVHDGLHRHAAVQGDQTVQQEQQRNVEHALAQNRAD